MNFSGKEGHQIFNPRPGRESNRGPQDWEAEILTTAPTPPLVNKLSSFHLKLLTTAPTPPLVSKLSSFHLKLFSMTSDSGTTTKRRDALQCGVPPGIFLTRISHLLVNYLRNGTWILPNKSLALSSKLPGEWHLDSSKQEFSTF